MSTQSNSPEKGHPTLSDKARRLLAAHDREVSGYRSSAAIMLGAYEAQFAN